VRVKRTKKSPPAAKSASRSKNAAVAAVSTHSWLTSSRTIVSGMIFVVVAAALLTAREDAARVDVSLEAPKTAVAKPSTTSAPKPSAASSDQAFQPQAEGAAPVTITGCLESDEGTFRLTDASGADAPTSRSWKSGFLKKRPAQIELADAVGTLNLRQHVGRRVATTGTLIDREMRAHSVRRIGACE
jgi:hypothetical protein